VYIKSKEVWHLFTERIGFPIGKKSETIDKPRTITKAHWKDFANGVIGSDGTIFKDWNGAPRIRLRIRSEKLRDSVSSILRYYEIPHTLGKSFEKSRAPNMERLYERHFYRLDIYGNNVRKYLDVIGIWHPTQKKKLETIISSFDRVRESGAPR
jgi:hypothetical protein